MDINVLFDGIMKSINRFAGKIAEQWLQEKTQESGLVDSDFIERAVKQVTREAVEKKGCN